MIFNCTKCHLDICCPDDDRPRFEKRPWVCDSCWTPIFDRLYHVNQPRCRTFLSPMGDALGDRIVNSVVKDAYAKANPDEDITFGDGIADIFNLYKGRIKYDKIFWADVTQVTPPMYPKRIERIKHFLDMHGIYKIPDKYIWFSVTNEANALARIGIYPTWTEYRAWNHKLPMRYAVIHERQIKKVDEKNMEPRIAFALERWFIEHKMYAIIVGNDDVITGQDSQYLIDLRKRLTLPEIAWLIRDAFFYFGRDSGISHLAGACSEIPMVMYGMKSKSWAPKVEPSRMHMFDNGDDAIRFMNINFSVEACHNRTFAQMMVDQTDQFILGDGK